MTPDVTDVTSPCRHQALESVPPARVYITVTVPQFAIAGLTQAHAAGRLFLTWDLMDDHLGDPTP